MKGSRDGLYKRFRLNYDLLSLFLYLSLLNSATTNWNYRYDCYSILYYSHRNYIFYNMICFDDILFCKILPFLEFMDCVHIMFICKKFFKNMEKNDRIWKCYALNHYGREFWTKARQRNVLLSKPKKTYFEELKRIFVFETKARKKFTINEFYWIWHRLECIYLHCNLHHCNLQL